MADLSHLPDTGFRNQTSFVMPSDQWERMNRHISMYNNLKNLIIEVEKLYRHLCTAPSEDALVKNGTHNGHPYEIVSFDREGRNYDGEVRQIIDLVGSLKDHIKDAWKETGLPMPSPKPWEDLLNNDNSVAIVHDLWNLNKHGSLDRPPRSGFIPRLSEGAIEIGNSLGHVGGGSANDTLVLVGGEFGRALFVGPGGNPVPCRVRVSVLDEHRNTKGDFLDICCRAISGWNRVLKTFPNDVLEIKLT